LDLWFFFDNPWILNRFYIAGYVHHGFAVIGQCVILLYYSKQLYAILISSTNFNDDQRVIQVASLIKGSIDTVQIVMPFFGLPILLPIWIGLTQTADNPGMPYFFYYEFFFTVLIRGFSLSFGIFALRRGSIESTMGSEKRVSEEKSQTSKNFPSFTVEELTDSKKPEFEMDFVK